MKAQELANIANTTSIRNSYAYKNAILLAEQAAHNGWRKVFISHPYVEQEIARELEKEGFKYSYNDGGIYISW